MIHLDRKITLPVSTSTEYSLSQFTASMNINKHIQDLKDDITYYGDGVTHSVKTIWITKIPLTNKIIHLARVDTLQGVTALDNYFLTHPKPANQT